MDHDHLGREAPDHLEVHEVRVLGDNEAAMRLREIPYVLIRRGLQSSVYHMNHAGIGIHQSLQKPGRQVVVQQQLHALRWSWIRSRSDRKSTRLNSSHLGI